MMCFSKLPMRFSLGGIAVLLLIAPAWPQAKPAASVTAGWEGESKCTLPDSPCHEEHALYRIAADKKNPAQLKVDGYKVVAGSPEFMVTLICRYRADQANLSCTGNATKRDDWEFHISGETMTDTLTIGAGKPLPPHPASQNTQPSELRETPCPY
jgi:hypothetical protein